MSENIENSEKLNISYQKSAVMEITIDEDYSEEEFCAKANDYNIFCEYLRKNDFKKYVLDFFKYGEIAIVQKVHLDKFKRLLKEKGTSYKHGRNIQFPININYSAAEFSIISACKYPSFIKIARSFENSDWKKIDGKYFWILEKKHYEAFVKELEENCFGYTVMAQN